MTRLLTLLAALFSCSLAFAEEGEVPMETVGIGGIIGFFVVCIVMAGIFFWYMRPGAKKEPGDKIGEKK
ncbi:MAG: hypothetical protein A3H91_05455 [Gammaproteobacteria bacterium RIFCSPLOWO2_02_FULL_61_13]|nr:MAG: hypothetical protein A3H91_05455 [Gammaproteobacteria bacterium RIFCSPLOWO2_02_FULL_61_13]